MAGRLTPRHLRPHLEECLDAYRVVVLHGPRQSGKSTLARLVAAERDGTYTSLDDDAARGAALVDPRGFLLDQRHPLVVDEVQLGGDRLIRAIKQIVDLDSTPGRFLLTGSTNFLTVPTISESLAGRARILRLLPLSQAELAGPATGGPERWFDDGTAGCAPPERPPGAAPVFAASDVEPRPLGGPPARRLSRRDYMELVCRGGYPESLTLPQHLRRGWFESYAETVIERDVVALGDLRRRSALPLLLEWIAAGTGREVNLQAAAARLGLDRATLASYLGWMETVFLVQRLPSWSRNPSARPVRRPKMHIIDTGLAAGLLGLDPEALTVPTSPSAGPLLETFVVGEITRQLAASEAGHRLHHYRDHQGHEIDLLVERPGGAVLAIEIKATSSPSVTQLRHVAWLRDRLDSVSPGTFRAGILAHTGDQHFDVGDRLHIRPIDSLWS
jgi:hypothetical protein